MRTSTAPPGKLDCDADMPVSRWPLRMDSGRSVPWKSFSLRLVIEQFHLRRAARLEQIDDALGLAERSAASRADAGWQPAAYCAQQSELASAAMPSSERSFPKKCRRVMQS